MFHFWITLGWIWSKILLALVTLSYVNYTKDPKSDPDPGSDPISDPIHDPICTTQQNLT